MLRCSHSRQSHTARGSSRGPSNTAALSSGKNSYPKNGSNISGLNIDNSAEFCTDTHAPRAVLSDRLSKLVTLGILT